MIWLIVATALAAELTFEDAVREAADAPSGRIPVAQAEAARAEARGAAAWENPTVSWDVQTGQRALAVSVPIGVAPLARAAGVGPAVDAIDVRRRAAEVTAGAAAGAAWLDARRAADHAATAHRMEELAVRLGQGAAARVANGEWSRPQGTLAQADAARALDRALAWEQEAQRALARLSVLVGEPVDGLAPWQDVPEPPTPDVATLPAVVAADLEARAALANRLAARLALIPALEVAGGWQWGEQAGPIYGASITLPLFATGASGSRAAGARADEATATAELATLDARAALAAAEAEVRVAERLAAAWEIPGIDDALDATVRLFDAGELSITDYQAQRDLAIAAAQGAIDARWRLARARLAMWELSGSLPGNE